MTDLVESDDGAETKADGAAARADRHERDADMPGRTQVARTSRWQPRRCRVLSRPVLRAIGSGDALTKILLLSSSGQTSTIMRISDCSSSWQLQRPAGRDSRRSGPIVGEVLRPRRSPAHLGRAIGRHRFAFHHGGDDGGRRGGEPVTRDDRWGFRSRHVVLVRSRHHQTLWGGQGSLLATLVWLTVAVTLWAVTLR